MKTRHDPIQRSVIELARQLRSRPAAAERTAWRLLRNRRMLGLKFRRQHPIDGFVVDFYCAQLRLVLEIDGGVHAGHARADCDRARTDWLESRAYRVLRVSVAELSEARLAELLRHELALRPPLRISGEGVRG